MTFEFNPDRHYHGKPCKHGHGTVRYRANSGCVYCERKHHKAWNKNNREQKKQTTRHWREENREQNREIERHWRENNRERRREITRCWRKKNPERSRELDRVWRENNRDLRREATRRWSKANPDVCAEQVRSYKANKLQARPPWYEVEACRRIYAKARKLGGDVDHVVPLRSDLVCGLHCWDNLQVLPKDTNSSKGNRHWPNHPEES